MSNTDAVRKHRQTSGLLRVEVSVPTPEDAAAVRAFAKQRRRRDPLQKIPVANADEAALGLANLDDLTRRLSPEARTILHIFTAGLLKAQDTELLARGQRMAANFLDIAEMHSRRAGGGQ